MEINREFINANLGKRFNIEFEDGTMLNKVEFFISSCNNMCYKNSRQRRTGRVFFYLGKVKTITEVKKKEYTDLDNAKQIIGRIHKNVWTDIQENLNKFIQNKHEVCDEFKWHWRGKLNFRSITSLLTTRQQEELKQAFENKTEFSWYRRTTRHTGRDLSINTKLGEDGIFRAWFSSEYMGCGNGDYYLLLSPTTAIYYERD